MLKTKEELNALLEAHNYTNVREELFNAVLALSGSFNDDELIKIYEELAVKLIGAHPELAFGEEMISEGNKDIEYQDGEDTHTKSEGIRTKESDVLNNKRVRTNKKQLAENNITGNKRSNARDPHVEENYRKRVAVHASTLRERANWGLGVNAIELAIKASVENYTKKYNETFGTNFEMHYAKPKKDWLTWYAKQQLLKLTATV